MRRSDSEGVPAEEWDTALQEAMQTLSSVRSKLG
jgi:hypothetical protein